VLSERRQRVVVERAEMIGQRLNRNSAVDAFFVDDSAKPNDFPSVGLIPFIGEKLDVCAIFG
jgi:hypothetical protein